MSTVPKPGEPRIALDEELQAALAAVERVASKAPAEALFEVPTGLSTEPHDAVERLSDGSDSAGDELIFEVTAPDSPDDPTPDEPLPQGGHSTEPIEGAEPTSAPDDADSENDDAALAPPTPEELVEMLAASKEKNGRLRAKLKKLEADRVLARRLATSEALERARKETQLRKASELLEQLRADHTRAQTERRRFAQEFEALKTSETRTRKEMDAMRDRRKREQEEQRLHGSGRPIAAFLPVLDHLDMAIEHARSHPERIVEGVGMVREQFRQILMQLGVQTVQPSVGEPFQPEVHEAVAHAATDLQLPNTVIECARAGYVLNGRLLRPARVIVAGALVPEGAAPPEVPTPSATGDVIPPSEPANAPEDIAVSGEPSPVALEDVQPTPDRKD